MLVKEIMVKKVKTVKEKDKVIKAFSIMMKLGIRHLPVQSEDKKLVGIISDRDIRQSMFPWQGVKFEKDLFLHTKETLLVEEIMTKNPVVVNPGTCVEEAAHLLNAYKVGGLPVVNDKKILVGIMTKSDVIEIFITMMEFLQKSSRIDIAIKDDQKKIKEVEKIISNKGGEIISIGKYPVKRKNNHIYYFRLKQCDIGKISEVIAGNGFEVVSTV